ncbi:MAG: DUF4252 domain-containing protein [Flavobacteriaceae bacterium]|nr:DUF4252 domain-containing protein [Flavobacteriaceae bacterium]
MKKFVSLILVFLFLSSCKSTSDFQTFYNDHKATASFSIGLSGTLGRMFIPKKEKELLGPLLKKASHYRLMVFQENDQKTTKHFSRFIKGHNYEQLVRISENKERIDVYFQEDKDAIIRELIVRIKTADEFVILACKTALTSEDIAILSASFKKSIQ